MIFKFILFVKGVSGIPTLCISAQIFVGVPLWLTAFLRLIHISLSPSLLSLQPAGPKEADKEKCRDVTHELIFSAILADVSPLHFPIMRHEPVRVGGWPASWACSVPTTPTFWPVWYTVFASNSRYGKTKVYLIS